MKKVFTNANDVIHLFAQQTQNEARCSNVFFKNTKIYSYGHHYLLGVFIDDNTILINDKGYSNTTSKHIHLLRYATKQYRQFFTTETDLQWVYNEVSDLSKKLANSRKPELYIDKILSLYKTLNEYLTYTKTLSTVKKDVRYKSIKKIALAVNKNFEKYKAILIKHKTNEANLRRKKIEKKLIEFKNYEIDTFRIGDEDFVRLSKDKTKVETSQGVIIDVRQAKALYEAIVSKQDIKGLKIDNYTVKSFNKTLIIGCHSINKKNLHEVGKLL